MISTFSGSVYKTKITNTVLESVLWGVVYHKRNTEVEFVIYISRKETITDSILYTLSEDNHNVYMIKEI